jgi:hypothetical protein
MASPQFRSFPNPTLPYITFLSPTSGPDSYTAGQNTVISPTLELARRPGFATNQETAGPTHFLGTIQRIFGWRRWDSTSSGATAGSFFVMLCETTATTSKVYKQEIGVDAIFQLVYTATATDGIPFDFIEANNFCFMGNGNVNDMRKYDGRNAPYSDGQYTSKWGISAPSSALVIDTSAAGTLNASAGYNYVSVYGNSSTGHLSNASPISACTATFSAKTASFTVTKSTDPQVDEIHVFRTTDNGGTELTEFRELSTSPFANATATVTDQDADEDLQDSFSPGLTINDPPPGLRGFGHHAGRIWGFRNNEAWYSAFEEAPSGVPEECWPGALAHNADGNFYPYAAEVNGLATTNDGVGIWSALQINAVLGDSLDTFIRVKMADLQGARQNQAIKAFGGIVLWLDTMDTLWMLGGEEVGLAIRPDLSGIDHSLAQMALYLQGKRRWLILLDGGNEKLYVFDLDLKAWNTPWPIEGVTAIWSGETYSGHIDLLAAISGRIVKLTEGAFNDVGVPYAASVTLGLTALQPDAKPESLAVVDSINIERNDAGDLSAVEICLDDNPDTGTFVNITANLQDAPTRSRTSSSVVAKQYPVGATGTPVLGRAKRASVRLSWPAEDRDDRLYGFSIGYRSV